MRRRVMATLLAVLGLYGLVELAAQRLILLPSFLELEQNEARKDVERVRAALQREIGALQPLASDWGHWDATYEFVKDRNEAYRKDNLVPESVEAAHVSLLAMFDRSGAAIWHGVSADAADHGLDLAWLASDDEESAARRRALFRDEPRTGVLSTGAGPILIASAPILRGDGTGPARGHIVFGKLVNERTIVALADQAQVELALESVVAPAEHMDVGSVPSPTLDVLEGTALFGPIRLSVDDQTRRGAITVLDLLGAPAFSMTVSIPRLISSEGRTALGFAAASVGFAGLLVILAIQLLLGRMVFRPLEIVTQHAASVGQSQDVHARLGLHGYQEFDVLARAIDDMLEQLADARAHLLDQSFRSGVAEMASGVLHNIGNSMVPLSHKLHQASEELRQIPIAELETAVAEFDAADTPDERRGDVEAFLCMAAAELTEITKRTNEIVESARTHSEHVQQILTDQNRLSRAERVLEPLEMTSLVTDGLTLLGDPLSSRIEPHVHVAPDTPKAYAARVAVQQVVGNLLVNAAESVAEARPEGERGQIDIYITRGEGDDADAVVLRVVDDGVGFTPDTQSRLFERGFSTKQRGSGLGLHWSSTTASALGGRIRATSEGPGRGACFELVLPAHPA